MPGHVAGVVTKDSDTYMGINASLTISVLIMDAEVEIL